MAAGVDRRSYDEKQADAILTVCATCQRAVYMVIPKPQCAACTHGCPPLGKVVTMTRDVSGVPIVEGDY